MNECRNTQFNCTVCGAHNTTVTYQGTEVYLIECMNSHVTRVSRELD